MPNNMISCPDNSMPYTIVAGDTFFSVARTFGISVDFLMGGNPGVDPNRLYIGQVICVPIPGVTCPANSFAYTIKSGDTLYHLARRYNTTVNAIMKLNPNIDPDNLNVGETICI